MKNIRKYKKIKNRCKSKYDIGKNASDYGYESSQRVDNNQLNTTNQANLSAEGDALSKSNIPNLLSQGAQLASIYSQLGTGKVITSTTSNILNPVTSSGDLVSSFTNQEGTKEIVKMGSSTTGKALGTAIPIASALYSGYNLANTIGNFNNHMSASEMVNSSGSSTEYANGIAYTRNTGFDNSGVDKITSAQNTGDTINMVGSGAGLGASIGSIVPGLGTIAGGIIGAVGGLVGGLLGSSSREEEVRKAKDRANAQIYDTNAQTESSAATKGIQNQFYSSRSAKYGKSAGQPLNGDDEVGRINTPQGTSYGPISGVMNDKEVHGDIQTGQTSTPNPGVPLSKRNGTESIPTGSQNGDYDFQKNSFILSNNKPAYLLGTNATYAQLGMNNAELDMNLTNQKEQIKNEVSMRNNKKVSKSVAEYNNKWAQRHLNNIDQTLIPVRDYQKYLATAQQQQDELEQSYIEQMTYKCGKNSAKCGKDAYADGKGINPILGGISSLPYLISESSAANREVPYAQNSFVPNSNAQSALNTLGSLRYDPSGELSRMDQTVAQNRYQIASAGNLSAGQRAALSSSANNQLFAQRAAINADAYNKNAAYRTQYANAMMQSGQTEAVRQQQALAAQQEAYRQAVGAKQKLQAQARKNWYTVGRQTLQDYNTWDNANAMINLWNAKDKVAKKIKTNTSNNTKNNVVNQPNVIYTYDWNKYNPSEPFDWRTLLQNNK